MTDSSNADDIVFRPFDPTADVHHSHRNLPHWFQPGVSVFLTFRTADSMPRSVVERWLREQPTWLRDHGFDASCAVESHQINQLPPSAQREFRRLRDRLWHRSLDQCHGACQLRQPEIARMVGEALLHFNGPRYDLDSWVVMPNHVHLLVQFRPPHTLGAQTESWLRFSATRINEYLGRQGPFWQSEPFDHLVRSGEQFAYLRRYIAENPKQAHLRDGEFLYWSRETNADE